MPFAQAPSERGKTAVADVRHEPLWLAAPDRPEPRAPLAGRRTADLVVVGGGLTGLWTAVRALERRPGLEVVLVDGDRVGNAASGRNGGFCASSITHGYVNGIERWPDEFPTLYRLGVENLAAIEESIASYGIDCSFERTGDVTVATEPYQVEHLREHVTMLREHGVTADLLDADATRALVDSPTYLAGIRDPEVALVDPARLCWGLARVAESLGAHLYEGTPVSSVQQHGTGMRVTTQHGVIDAGQVALATAAHFPLLRRIRAWVVPVFDHVVTTAPLPPDVLASLGWPGREGVGDAGNQFHYYRLTSDDRLLWGGYDAVYQAGERPGSSIERDDFLTARLVTHLHETFPQLEGTPIEFAWAGAIDTCARFTAFWGRAHRGRVAYAVGFTGLGVGASRFGADVVLDLLWREKTERTALKMVRSKPLPFPPEPMRQRVIDWTRHSISQADANAGRRNLWLRTLDRMGLGFDS